MKDWQVAIPSYRRPETLVRKTLATMHAGGVPLERVTVFVADADEEHGYRLVLPKGVRIVRAVVGMHAVRNAITAHYPHGSMLVEWDDDIRSVVRRVDDRTLVPVTDLPALFDEAYDICEREHARLWGLYPVANPMFMKPGHTTSLRPIIGTVWGRVVDHAIAPLECEVKSDIERTLQYWTADGCVVRLNHYAVKQNARTEPGGQQEPGRRTHAKSAWAAHQLCERYPELCTMGRAFKGGHAEVRLRVARSATDD